MKIRAVHYDRHEAIRHIDLRLSLREAAALHALAGALTGHDHTRLGLADDESLFDAINAVFCQHYEMGGPAGAPDVGVAVAFNREADR